mmetsp:Transcript_28010/g.66226  ORF Transcript_28010/g.66226 Transcript_28010/m.66226 type:complete len:312 (-) Transcript_28010:585-1520(-)
MAIGNFFKLRTVARRSSSASSKPRNGKKRASSTPSSAPTCRRPHSRSAPAGTCTRTPVPRRRVGRKHGTSALPMEEISPPLRMLRRIISFTACSTSMGLTLRFWECGLIPAQRTTPGLMAATPSANGPTSHGKNCQTSQQRVRNVPFSQAGCGTSTRHVVDTFRLRPTCVSSHAKTIRTRFVTATSSTTMTMTRGGTSPSRPTRARSWRASSRTWTPLPASSPSPTSTRSSGSTRSRSNLTKWSCGPWLGSSRALLAWSTPSIRTLASPISGRLASLLLTPLQRKSTCTWRRRPSSRCRRTVPTTTRSSST